MSNIRLTQRLFGQFCGCKPNTARIELWSRNYAARMRGNTATTRSKTIGSKSASIISPDPQVIRLKYGRIGQEHTGEGVPHVHLQNKTQVALTDEMTFAMFAEWAKAHLRAA